MTITQLLCSKCKSLASFYLKNGLKHEQFTIHYFHQKAMVLQEKLVCLSSFSRNTDI